MSPYTSIPDIRSSIDDHHQRYRTEAVQKAKDLATQEHPVSGGEAGTYLGEIKARYQGLARLVNSALHPKAHEAMGRAETQVAQQETAELDQELTAKRHRLNVLRMDAPRSSGAINVPLRAIIVLVITAMLFTAQGLWESGAFLVTGETRLRASVIGIGVTIAFALFAHAAVWLIRKLKHRPWRILVGVATLLTAFVGYYVLGTLRARFLAEYLGRTEGLVLDPWMFALLSLVLFVAVGVLSLMLLPSVEQVEAYRARRKLHREGERMGREVHQLEQERKALPRRAAEKMAGHARMVETAEELRRHLRDLHRETHLAFVQTNVLRRLSPAPAELFQDPDELDLNDR